jgi:predicted nucleic acid-binding protein
VHALGLLKQAEAAFAGGRSFWLTCQNSFNQTAFLALQRAAMDLLLARQDKTYSLCDAVSFVLVRQRYLTEALTTDHHFEQEGFQQLL